VKRTKNLQKSHSEFLRTLSGTQGATSNHDHDETRKIGEHLKLKKLLLLSRSVLILRFGLAALGLLSTAAIANHLFASKAMASVESCESHLKNSQGYRKWAKMYQPLVAQNASYRGAFQNYSDLAEGALNDYQKCKSAE
jgi:hypothetical protein